MVTGMEELIIGTGLTDAEMHTPVWLLSKGAWQRHCIAVYGNTDGRELHWMRDARRPIFARDWSGD